MKLRHIAPQVLALATTVGFAAPAVAAAPANDTHAGRSAVGSVPFTTTQDTSAATTDADDAELNAACGAPAMDASVWYEFTATEDGPLVADVSGSSYSAGVFVATGAPGSFEVQACAPGAAAWDAVAGQTYSIVVIDDQLDGGGNGGQLSLTIDKAPPTPQVDVTVDRTARFTQSGSIVLSGTVTCDAGVITGLEAEATQTVGRTRITGWGWTEVDCADGTPQAWSMELVSDTGLFRGGKAASVTFAFACGAFDCGLDYEERVVQVSGKR